MQCTRWRLCLHYFPWCYRKLVPFYLLLFFIPKDLSGQVFLSWSAHCPLLFNANPCISSKGEMSRFLTLSSCMPLGKSLAVFEMTFPYLSNTTGRPCNFQYPFPLSCALIFGFLSPAHNNFSFRVLFLFLIFCLFGSIFCCCCRGPPEACTFKAPAKHLKTLPSLLQLALLLSYTSKGIETRLGRARGSPDSICVPQEMAEPRGLSTYQVLPDKHCPAGDGSWEETGEHSKEYSFNDWGQPATGDTDKDQSYLR